MELCIGVGGKSTEKGRNGFSSHVITRDIQTVSAAMLRQTEIVTSAQI